MMNTIGRLRKMTQQRSLLSRALSAIRRNNGTALYVPDDYGLVLGPELGAASNWNGATGDTVINVGAGTFTTTASAGFGSGANVTAFSGAIVSGKTYRVTFTVAFSVVGSGVRIKVGGTDGPTATTSGTYTAQVTATGTNAAVIFAVGAGSTFTVSAVSVREILSATTYIDSTGTQPVTAVGDLVGLLTDRSYGAGNLGVEQYGTEVTMPPETENTIFVSTVGKLYRIYASTTDLRFTFGQGWITLAVGWNYLVANAVNARYRNFSATTPVTFTPSVREVLGNHASQGTTASKPLVTRVPKRLGPNLVTNATFDVDASWTKGAGVTISAGVASIGAGAGYLEQGITTAAAKTYRVQATATGNPVYCGAWDSAGQGGALSGSPAGRSAGLVEFTFTANDTASFIGFTATGAGALTIDNISVQEVLEWSNALDFDGSNDLLTLSSVPFQITENHCVVVGMVASADGYKTAYGQGDASLPNRYKLGTFPNGQLNLSIRGDSGLPNDLTSPTGTFSLGVPFVATSRKVGDAYTIRKDGVVVGSASYTTFGATTYTKAAVGCIPSTTNDDIFDGNIANVVVIKGTISDADLQTIERWMAHQIGAAYAG